MTKLEHESFSSINAQAQGSLFAINHKAHNHTNTYAYQSHKQTRLFLEHAMCLDQL